MSVGKLAAIAVIAMVLGVGGCMGCGGGTTTQPELTSFGFEPDVNPGLSSDIPATILGDNVTATVPFGTDLTALVASFTSNGAKVMVSGVAQASGETKNDFTNPVTYVVANGNSEHAYTVALSVAPSTSKDFTSFAFQKANNPDLVSDAIGTITGTSIAITVPYGTDVHKLIATFTATGTSVAVGSTAQQSGTTENDFTSPVVYTVTAADGTTQQYTVTVSIAPSSSKDLTSFAFNMANNPGLEDNFTGVISGTDITVMVIYGATGFRTAPDVSALVATFSTTGTTVEVGTTTQVSGTTPNNFANPVMYTVTAADASTQVYTVRVMLLYMGD